jgi:hypothetical protein
MFKMFSCQWMAKSQSSVLWCPADQQILNYMASHHRRVLSFCYIACYNCVHIVSKACSKTCNIIKCHEVCQSLHLYTSSTVLCHLYWWQNMFKAQNDACRQNWSLAQVLFVYWQHNTIWLWENCRQLCLPLIFYSRELAYLLVDLYVLILIHFKKILWQTLWET